MAAALAVPAEEVARSAEDPSWENEQRRRLEKSIYDLSRRFGLNHNSPPMHVVRQSGEALILTERQRRAERAVLMGRINAERAGEIPLLGWDLRRAVRVLHPIYDIHTIAATPGRHLDYCSALKALLKTPLERCAESELLLQVFMCRIPKARALEPEVWCSRPDATEVRQAAHRAEVALRGVLPMMHPLRTAMVRQQLFFPDRKLIQFDCGKLQVRAVAPPPLGRARYDPSFRNCFASAGAGGPAAQPQERGPPLPDLHADVQDARRPRVLPQPVRLHLHAAGRQHQARGQADHDAAVQHRCVLC